MAELSEVFMLIMNPMCKLTYIYMYLHVIPCCNKEQR